MVLARVAVLTLMAAMPNEAIPASAHPFRVATVQGDPRFAAQTDDGNVSGALASPPGPFFLSADN